MEKVSVILTSYNSGSNLQQTLDSIFSQRGIGTHFEFELLVVDDCSTDNTREILSSNKIDYISTNYNTGGPNAGRNIGLKNATGDYITFIDHDDIWLPEKTMCQLKLAARHPIVSTGYMVLDRNFNRTVNNFEDLEIPIEYKQNETFLSKLSKDKTGQKAYFSTLMIQKKLKAQLFEENFGMLDFDWILRIFENNSSAEIPKCLMRRYVNSTNLSLNTEYRKKDYYYTLLVLDKYKNKYPNLVRKAVKRLNGSQGRFLYLSSNMREAREYFLKSEFNLTLFAYLATSFVGSDYVKKHFHLFG